MRLVEEQREKAAVSERLNLTEKVGEYRFPELSRISFPFLWLHSSLDIKSQAAQQETGKLYLSENDAELHLLEDSARNPPEDDH